MKDEAALPGRPATSQVPLGRNSSLSAGVTDKLREAIERADERLKRMEQDARDLIAFADGLEEGGFRDYAQRSRVVARDLLTCASELRAERSARVAIQKQRDAFERLATKYAPGGEEPAV